MLSNASICPPFFLRYLLKVFYKGIFHGLVACVTLNLPLRPGVKIRIWLLMGQEGEEKDRIPLRSNHGQIALGYCATYPYHLHLNDSVAFWRVQDDHGQRVLHVRHDCALPEKNGNASENANGHHVSDHENGSVLRRSPVKSVNNSLIQFNKSMKTTVAYHDLHAIVSCQAGESSYQGSLPRPQNRRRHCAQRSQGYRL